MIAVTIEPRLLVFALGLVALQGCFYPEETESPYDLCELDYGGPSCRDGVHYYCDKDGRAESKCEYGCVGEGSPSCAPTAEPDPRCDERRKSSYCMDGTIRHCEFGYVWTESECEFGCYEWWATKAFCVPEPDDPGRICLAEDKQDSVDPADFEDKDNYRGQFCSNGKAYACNHLEVETVTTCKQACVEYEVSAFCAASDEPDPRCEGLDGTVCVGTDLLKCTVGGYRKPAEECMAPVSECVDTETKSPFCAAPVYPHPKCEKDFEGFCASNTAFSCKDGYAKVSRHCGVHVCREYENGDKNGAGCAISTEPDPSCLTEDLMYYQDNYHCKGDAVYRCRKGWAYLHRECSEGCDEGSCVN